MITAQMARLQEGQAIAAALPFLRNVFQHRSAAVMQQVFRQIQTGEPLSPQAALQAWLELYEIDKLEKSLTQAVRIGQTASVELAPYMQQEE